MIHVERGGRRRAPDHRVGRGRTAITVRRPTFGTRHPPAGDAGHRRAPRRRGVTRTAATMTGRVDAPTFATVGVAIAVVIAAVALRPRQRRAVSAAGGAPARSARTLEAWRSRHPDAARRTRAPWPHGATTSPAASDPARRCATPVATLPADPATERATAPLRLAIDRGVSVADAIARVDGGGTHLRLALGVIATASRVGGPSAASIDRAADAAPPTSGRPRRTGDAGGTGPSLVARHDGRATR